MLLKRRLIEKERGRERVGWEEVLADPKAPN